MKKKFPILKFLLNEYVIVTVIFIIAMLVSDSHNYLDRLKYKQTIENMETEIDYYRTKTEHDRARLKELQSDKENLEKFARERYQMQNEDEDIYRVEYE